jgi:hypothetical protein
MDYLSKNSIDKIYNPLPLSVDGDCMDQQQPYQSQDIPPQGTQDAQPPSYTPPQDPYAPPYQQPSSPPPSQSSYPQGRGNITGLFKTDKMVQMLVLGLFLMFIGSLLITVVSTSGGPNQWDEKYDNDDNGILDNDNRDTYWRDQRTYDMLRDIGTILGSIIISFGMLIVVLVLFGGGIVNQELDKFVRLGMLIAAGLIVAWLGF